MPQSTGYLESDYHNDGGETVCPQWAEQEQIPLILTMPSAVPRDGEWPFGSWTVFMITSLSEKYF